MAVTILSKVQCYVYLGLSRAMVFTAITMAIYQVYMHVR